MLKNQKWYKATNLAERQDFYLVMTHDIDSLLSCNYLNQKDITKDWGNSYAV